MGVVNLLVEKRGSYAEEARNFKNQIKRDLGIDVDVRVINSYLIEGEGYSLHADRLKNEVFSDSAVDIVTEGEFVPKGNEHFFSTSLLSGHYNHRANWGKKAAELITLDNDIEVETSVIYAISGNITAIEFETIKKLKINPSESKEGSLEIPETIKADYPKADMVPNVEGFNQKTKSELEDLKKELGLSLYIEDLLFIQEYYKNEEKRDPTITEIMFFETYWSDHCRHTTFETIIDKVEFEGRDNTGRKDLISDIFQKYLEKHGAKNLTLMNMVTAATKEIKKEREKSGNNKIEIVDAENNACDIRFMADIDGKEVPYRLMFKNETHNHPSEFEPFGGVATCLGGGIRDPLSGRAEPIMYKGIAGIADPRVPMKETLMGKLPSRYIAERGAEGLSFYGNHIGLPAGFVKTFFHPGFRAKTMQCGALLAGAPDENIRNEELVPGDKILLIGGRTGRDGVGGASGSSKEATTSGNIGAEFPKGNPPEEGNIIELFREKETSLKIKKCNDYGAGGNGVAVGEMADGLIINLDAVPVKYAGLDGTEILLSESQERMAVGVAPEDVESFMEDCRKKGIECSVVAEVTEEKRLVANYQGQEVINISREFLKTNGATQHTTALIGALETTEDKVPEKIDFAAELEKLLTNLEFASQRGQMEQFDFSVKSNTIIAPFGGKTGTTPAQAMCAYLPVDGKTNTAVVMANGYDPCLSDKDPFLGTVRGIISAITKVVLTGADYKDCYLSIQEYFRKLGNDPKNWGLVVQAALALYHVQKTLGVPAIGGKDSMSGTFKDINVPSTATTFAVAPMDARNVVTSELKEIGTEIWEYEITKDEYGMPDLEELMCVWTEINEYAINGSVLAAREVESNGFLGTLLEMGFGNERGFEISSEKSVHDLFKDSFNNIIIETKKGFEPSNFFKKVGQTKAAPMAKYNDKLIGLEASRKKTEETLKDFFPVDYERTAEDKANEIPITGPYSSPRVTYSLNKSPKVVITKFPGTTGHLDAANAFKRVGVDAEMIDFVNLTPQDIEESYSRIANAYKEAQIIVFPGGHAGGDEPDGAGKFINAFIRNPQIAEVMMDRLTETDLLVLGLGNGANGLVRSGLIQYGEIRDTKEGDLALIKNAGGRHKSRMASVRVMSTLSPWLSGMEHDCFKAPLSSSEARFAASKEVLAEMAEQGQVALNYIGLDGYPTYSEKYNLVGSMGAIAGVTSPEGNVFASMLNFERVRSGLYVNIPGVEEQIIIANGVCQFTGEDPKLILKK